MIAGVAAAAFLPGLLITSPGEQAHPIPGTVLQTTITSPSIRTPGPTIPVSPSANLSPTPSGPPGFTVTVSPTQITASRGETVTYTMRIEAQNGFSDKIHMESWQAFLWSSAGPTDLGIQEPPYPKTIEYPFTVPANWPPGITVNGILRSTGGGITREDQITLTVR